MTSERHLDWEGRRNVRDLGGLPAGGGRMTRRGAVGPPRPSANLTPVRASATTTPAVADTPGR